MTSKVSEKVRKLFLSWKGRSAQTLPRITNTMLVKPFLRLGTCSIVAERSSYSAEFIEKVVKKFQEGYSVIMIPSHPMARRHTLGMMYHCMKISEEISGEPPHVVLATDETTFIYIKIRFLNKLIQQFYRTVGNLAGHIMLNRYDPNSSFRAGIDIARLLRNQSIVVMAGEGYPRHDSRKYVDIPNIVESFYTKLKNKNMLAPGAGKIMFVNELVRDIQNLIDREDKVAYRNGKLSEHVIDSIRQLLLRNVPSGYSLDVEDIIDELLLSWGERFGPLQGIDPVLGVTVQPRHKALILPVTFTEQSKKTLHIDVRDFFLIDNVSYTEIKASFRDMETIQRCNAAMDMLDDRQHFRTIREICQITGIVYEPFHDVFEEYHVGEFPYQEMLEILNEKRKSPRNTMEQKHAETYQAYLHNFKIAAEIAALDKEDRALFQEVIKCNTADLAQLIPSVRIRQAWKSRENNK